MSGGIPQLFLNLGTRSVCVCGQHHSPAAFTPGKDPVPIVQDAGWAPVPVWIYAENLAPPGFDPRTFQPIYIYMYIQGVPGGMDKTSGECSLC